MEKKYATEFNYNYAKEKIKKDFGEEVGNKLIELSESFIPERPYPKEMEWEMKFLDIFIIRKYYETNFMEE